MNLRRNLKLFVLYIIIQVNRKVIHILLLIFINKVSNFVLDMFEVKCTIWGYF